MARNVFIVKFGAVEYFDLCQHEGLSRADFFNDADLKRCTVYGLIYETEDLVKVLWETDDSHDTECGGIVIPKACVIEMKVFESESDYEEEMELPPPIKGKKLSDAN
jgi:hypothetical protein